MINENSDASSHIMQICRWVYQAVYMLRNKQEKKGKKTKCPDASRTLENNPSTTQQHNRVTLLNLPSTNGIRELQEIPRLNVKDAQLSILTTNTIIQILHPQLLS